MMRRERRDGDRILEAQPAPMWDSRRSEQDRREAIMAETAKGKFPQLPAEDQLPGMVSSGMKSCSDWCLRQGPKLSPPALPMPLGICPGGHGREVIQKALLVCRCNTTSEAVEKSKIPGIAQGDLSPCRNPGHLRL